MKFLQETTKWRVPTPNHTYIFDGALHIVGYIKEGTTEAVKFSARRRIDKRGRTFVELKKPSFDMRAFNGH